MEAGYCSNKKQTHYPTPEQWIKIQTRDTHSCEASEAGKKTFIPQVVHLPFHKILDGST